MARLASIDGHDALADDDGRLRIVYLGVEDIDPSPANVNRMEDEAYDLLVQAMGNPKIGFLQPVLVRPKEGGRYEIIDGEHRWRAAKENGFFEIPCVVADGVDDDYAKLMQIGMNQMRGRLDLAAVGSALADLLAGGNVSVPELTLSGFASDEVDDLVRSATSAGASAEEIMHNGAAPAASDAAPEMARPYSLELTYATKQELAKAKRGLRKADGGGKGADMARGLLKLIDGD